MTDARLQWLQKPESTTDACSEYERDGDFERGLEELMRGQLVNLINDPPGFSESRLPLDTKSTTMKSSSNGCVFLRTLRCSGCWLYACKSCC
ncbi:hypothetical protein Hanom_Chr11g01041491 [Helianthus anomalus]